jgi:hypothetical protein
MIERRTVVHFDAGFSLKGHDGTLPPGDYAIEFDEEPIEIGVHTAYRRMATYIHLPAIGARSLTSQLVPIDAQDLADALARDAIS